MLNKTKEPVKVQILTLFRHKYTLYHLNTSRLGLYQNNIV